PGRRPLPRPTARRALPPLALAAALGLLAWFVTTRGGVPYGVDTGPHRWSVAHRPSAMATAARAVTDLGTSPVAYLAAALGGWLAAGAAAGRRQRALTVLLALAVLAVGQSLRTGLMLAVHRARPPVADWAVHAAGHAFPSGHTATSAMAAGLLAWGLLRALPGRRGQVLAGVCGVLAVAVGCSRVYLGVHWPTDVLGGWLFAACWLTLTLPPLTAFTRRGAPGSGPSGSAPPEGDADQTDTPWERR
ncbi:MAG TPA: phosphatase PAP2 family protein, partial [Streptomyces sp.]